MRKNTNRTMKLSDIMHKGTYAEGDMRGEIVVVVQQDVPFYHAVKVLQKFDENLATLYIGEFKNNFYKAEMFDNLITVSRLRESPVNTDVH